MKIQPTQDTPGILAHWEKVAFPKAKSTVHSQTDDQLFAKKSHISGP